MTDALDELNAQIEVLRGIAQREQERLLDELIAAPWPARPVSQAIRSDVAQLALDYAEWTRIAKGFGDQLQRRERPISVVK